MCATTLYSDISFFAAISVGGLLLLGEDIYSQHLREKSSVVCKRLPSISGLFTVNVPVKCNIKLTYVSFFKISHLKKIA